MQAPHETRSIQRFHAGSGAAAAQDALAAEDPLEIRLNGQSVVVTMRTPGHDEELALGFLHNEGAIASRSDVTRVEARAEDGYGNVVDVTVPPERVARGIAGRAFHATSACGVCGQATLENVRTAFPPVHAKLQARASVLLGLPATLRAQQEVFALTGGLHAAGLFTPDGQLACVREDIGRHNAVDKVVGWALREDALPLSGHVLGVSGRAGFEVLQKAAAAGIPLVAAVGPASSLAARLAEQAGITLVGFLKADGFNVYTHPERILP